MRSDASLIAVNKITGTRLSQPQPAAQRETILARQHDVQHDHVDALGLEQRKHAFAVRRFVDRQATLGQELAEHVANALIVVDEQHVGAVWRHHDGTLPQQATTVRRLKQNVTLRSRAAIGRGPFATYSGDRGHRAVFQHGDLHE